jgi:integrase
VRAQAVRARHQQRWEQLQLQAAASSGKVEKLVEKFLGYLGDVGEQRSLFAATPMDVVAFCMERDTHGRTVVHDKSCRSVGTHPLGREPSCSCPRRLKATSLDSMIGSLRGVFRDMGRTGPWCYRTFTGNPCDAKEVDLFLKYSGKEQLRAGVEVKRASLFSNEVYELLFNTILKAWGQLMQAHEFSEAASAAQDMLLYSIMWSTGLRASDALGLLRQNAEWFTQSGGSSVLYLYVTGSKTETRVHQTRMFRIRRNGSGTSPLDAWVSYQYALDRLGVRWPPGAMFRSLKEQGTGVYALTTDLDYRAIEPRFRQWAERAKIPASITLHSFHGSHAADREAVGVPRQTICQEMAWQESTRSYYVDGRPVIQLSDVGSGARFKHLGP